MKYDFKTAYSLIIDAYFKNEVEPYNGEFCFCGNLSDNRCDFNSRRGWNPEYYTPEEYLRMEYALLSTIQDQTIGGIDDPFGTQVLNDGELSRFHIQDHPNYENALFNGMCAAIEVLRNIHSGRGETTEEYTFTRRVLQTV